VRLSTIPCAAAFQLIISGLPCFELLPSSTFSNNNRRQLVYQTHFRLCPPLISSKISIQLNCPFWGGVSVGYCSMFVAFGPRTRFCSRKVGVQLTGRVFEIWEQKNVLFWVGAAYFLGQKNRRRRPLMWRPSFILSAQRRASTSDQGWPQA